MSDYRVRILIRNERLLSAVEKAGYPSVRQCSILNGYPEHKLGNLVNGTIKPLDPTTGTPTKFCKEVLEIVGKNLEECFTKRQLQGFKKNSYQVTVDEKELKQLVSEHKNEGGTLLESELDKKITEVLSTRLNPRQEKIIRMYFGLGIDREHTLTEISKCFNISKGRAGQILQISIRKLQHVSSVSLLLSTGFYDKFTKVDVDSAVINEAEVYLQREQSITQ